MFRARRDRAGPDRFLALKHSLFWIGAGLGVVGMARDIDWMVWTAVVALGLGVALGMAGRRERRLDEEEPMEEDVPPEG
ncbi:MAG: hypothetical protein WEB88_07820 [Gemmatimonadota bacterium]